MSSRTRVALSAADKLEDLAEYYDDRCVAYVDAGQAQRDRVASGQLPPESLGARRAEVGPALYEQAKHCQALARQLVLEHAKLIEQTRAWERIR